MVAGGPAVVRSAGGGVTRLGWPRLLASPPLPHSHSRPPVATPPQHSQSQSRAAVQCSGGGSPSGLGWAGLVKEEGKFKTLSTLVIFTT